MQGIIEGELLIGWEFCVIVGGWLHGGGVDDLMVVALQGFLLRFQV